MEEPTATIERSFLGLLASEWAAIASVLAVVVAVGVVIFQNYVSLRRERRRENFNIQKNWDLILFNLSAAIRDVLDDVWLDYIDQTISLSRMESNSFDPKDRSFVLVMRLRLSALDRQAAVPFNNLSDFSGDLDVEQLKVLSTHFFLLADHETAVSTCMATVSDIQEPKHHLAFEASLEHLRAVRMQLKDFLLATLRALDQEQMAKLVLISGEELGAKISNLAD